MDITQGAPFESFGLSEATMRAIHNKGYESCKQKSIAERKKVPQNLRD